MLDQYVHRLSDRSHPAFAQPPALRLDYRSKLNHGRSLALAET